MGSGFKVFGAGSVLTASDVNNYLMEQTTPVFSSTTTRDAAITAPEEGMTAYTSDTDTIWYYTGSAWTVFGNGALQSWTPTWTNVTIGNATVTANYVQFGKSVHIWLVMTMGTTTTIGASDLRFSLPVTASSSASYVNALYTVAGNAYFGYADVNGTAAFLRINNVSGTYPVPNQLGTTTPGTWNTGSQIIVSGTYLAA